MAHADIQDIREKFDYADRQWGPDYREGRIDMRYVAGFVWSELDRRSRGDRPMMVFDEFGSFTNRVINNLRMNKRGIVVTPADSRATEKSAKLIADKIRQIQYESQAQAAYITAAENAIQRGFGFVRVGKDYANPMSMDMELKIRRVPNPDSIYIDPDFTEASAQDMKYAFVTEEIPRKRFKQMFPKAKPMEYEEGGMVAKGWVRDNTVLLREHWCVEEKPDHLFVVSTPEGAIHGFLRSDMERNGGVIMDGYLYIDGQPAGLVVGDRATTRKEVYQQITNGQEILEEHEWEGKYIPIIPMFGKELWYSDSDAGHGQRHFYSLIRLARDPAKLHCYYRSTEAEVIGLSPKVPYIGYKGQFDGSENDWNDMNRNPRPYLEVNAYTAEIDQGSPLPIPQRNNYEPPVQALEMGSESARRGIQSAMGIDTLPTAAQRANQKSGIALQKIDEQQNIGSYHFTDAYNLMLTQTGRVLANMIPHVYDTPRQMQVLGADEKYEMVSIQGNEFGGEHDVIIKPGPNQDSERDEALEFSTQLATPELIGAAIQGNPKASKIVGLAIRLRAGGPLMDEIADVLDPPPDGDPKQMVAQLTAAVQESKQAIEALNAHSQEVEAELAREKDKTAADERMNAQNNATKLLIEEMRQGLARSEQEIERLKAVLNAEMGARANDLKRIGMMGEAVNAANQPTPEPQELAT